MDSTYVQAFSIAAEWRGILARDQVARMLEHLKKQQIRDQGGLRAWLSTAQGLSTELGRKLLDCLMVDKYAGPDGFGEWQPLVILHESGETATLLAHDDLHGWVLIKTLGEAAERGNEFHKRFEREIEIVQTLKHKNMVSCLGSGVTKLNRSYLAFEYVPCITLTELVTRQTISPQLALSIVRKVVDVLDLMDQNGLVHRDIKPGNVYASFDGLTKLGNFGTARSTSASRPDLTVEGSVLVAPHYASPEQCMGSTDVDVRSDLFSCACILYFLLIGEDPYTGKMHDIMRARFEGSIPNILDKRSDLPAGLQDILNTALAKEPTARYANAAAMRDAIDALLQPLGGLMGDVGLGEASVILSSEDTERIDKELTNMISGSQRKESDITGSHAVHAFTGSLDKGATEDWVCLQENGGPSQIMLFARMQLIAGKMNEAPIDLCLRNYPVADKRMDCAKISRRHMAFVFQERHGAASVMDFGSANGTALNETLIAAEQSVTLQPELTYRLNLSGVLALTVNAKLRRNEPVSSLPGCDMPVVHNTTLQKFGLSSRHVLDSICIKRTQNAEERCTAMVLRRISIGAQGADMHIHGAQSGQDIEIALFAGHWIWRDGTRDWKALSIGQKIQCGGKEFTLYAGHHAQFD